MGNKFARLGLPVVLVAAAAFLAACSTIYASRSASSPYAATAAGTPAPAGLGTQWGESRESRIVTVEVNRITPNRPDDVAQLFYNDADGVRASVGNNSDRQLNVLMAQGDVEWSVRDEADRPLTLERATQGADKALNFVGRKGARYTLLFHNLSERVYEVVATVDGLDVINGQPGSTRHTGYVLYPRATLRIDGFRKNDFEVAAFRFSAVDRAYAANTPAGDARNVGVIGAALFRLEIPANRSALRDDAALPPPNPFPAGRDPSYAPPPQYRK